MRTRLPSFALLLSFATSLSPALPAQSSEEPAPRRVIDDNLPELRRLLREGIQRKEPSANIWRRIPAATIFDGSYDWHSCIAAHWAGLSMARLTPDADLAKDILARLHPEAIAAERTFRKVIHGGEKTAAGRTQHHFVPYVDAWTLLLLDELARHEGHDTDEVRRFRLETEARLLAHLADEPFPETKTRGEEPRPIVVGSYRSWLFAYLALRIAGTRGDGATEKLAHIAAQKLDPQRELLGSYGGRLPTDFFDVRSLYEVVASLEASAHRPAAPLAREFTPLPASVTLGTVHIVGLCASEAWPAAVFAREDPAARERLEARTAEILGRRDLWADDFEVVSHWMPQFLWFGLWLADGRR